MSADDSTTMSFGDKVLPKCSLHAAAIGLGLRMWYWDIILSSESPAMITDHDPKSTTPEDMLDIGASEYDAYVYIPVAGGMVKG